MGGVHIEPGLIDAFVHASRTLVAAAAISLADVDVTTAQFRVLVLMASRGPQRPSDLADELQVAPSSATRMCQRLVDQGLVEREASQADRREVWLRPSPAGMELLRSVTRRRRATIARTLSAMRADDVERVVAVLHEFGRAAGEIPDSEWWFELGDVDAIVS